MRLLTRLRGAFGKREFGNPAVWILNDVLHQLLEITEQARDGRGIVEVGVVLASQPPTFVPQDEENVEVIERALRFRGNDRQLDAGEFLRLDGIALADEIQPKQRVMAWILGGAQILEYLLKTDILVGDGLQANFLNATEELGKSRVSGQIEPQHDVIDEWADDGLEFHTGTP